MLVLYSAGIGSKHHTGYQIKQNMHGSGSSDVYRLLKELAPNKFVEDRMLLNLKELSAKNDDGKYKRGLIEKINSFFDLKWEMGSEESEIEDDNARVRFEIGDDNAHISIFHDASNAILITLDQVKQYGYGFLTIFNGGKKLREQDRLIVKRNQKTDKLALYTTKYLEKRVRYLDIDINERAKKSISEIKNQAQSKYSHYNEDDMRDSPQILEVTNNRDNWLYRSNFRGFLLFLTHESQLGDIKKSNKEIHGLLSKASDEWIVKEAPFLICWQDFEMVDFNAVGTLRNIGAEFINQVNDDNIDNDYLLTRVTERYYDAVSFYFHWFGKSLFLARNKKYIENYDKCNIHDKLHRYRIETLKRLRTGFIKKVGIIDKILESDSLSM